MPSFASIHKIKQWRKKMASLFGIKTHNFNGASGSTADLKKALESVLTDLAAEERAEGRQGGDVNIQWMSDGFLGFKQIQFVNIGMRVQLIGVDSNQYANIRIVSVKFDLLNTVYCINA